MIDNKFILKLIGMLNKASSKRQINSNIKELEKAVNTIRMTATLAKGESKKQLSQTVRQLENQLTQIKLKTKIEAEDLKVSINDDNSLQSTTDSLQQFRSEELACEQQSQSAADKIKGLISSITRLGSVFGITSMAISNFQESIKTIYKNNSILKDISKTSNAAKSDIQELGSSAYDTASKFGLLSSDYLKAVQEFNKQGFYGEAGKLLGELSLKAQVAGNISAEMAQNYLLAANAAYSYKGNAEKLSAVLDGQNEIANKHNTTMEIMAAATEKAGSAAASAGVKINELSAMVGTISARTGEKGTAIGTGITSLLGNLQNISSDKIVSTLQKANASMTETVNGAEKLRNPIAILKDLAKTYNTLDENNPLKSEITTNIGQEYPEQLAALLKGWQDYENMLAEYSNGKDSAWEDARQSAQDLSGTLNKLSNSWTELVNSMISSNNLKASANLLDNIIQNATKLVSVLTPLGTIGAGAGLFASFKNTGKRRMSVRTS